jgi:hypothetical protein
MYISRHMQDLPRMAWLNAKQYKHHFASRKNQPGRSQEHVEAHLENAMFDAEAVERLSAFPLSQPFPNINLNAEVTQQEEPRFVNGEDAGSSPALGSSL